MSRSYEECLDIARQAYKEINEVINKWESSTDMCIGAEWDEYITIDGYGFTHYDLKKENG